MKKLVALLVILLLAASAVGTRFYLRVHEPYRGYAGSEQFIDIPAGDGSRAIGRRLVAAGIVRDEMTYRLAVWMSGTGRALKAGEYRFDRPMTSLAVIDKIVRGDVYVLNVTFPEGLNLREMSKIFEARGLGQAEAFVAAASDPSPIYDLDPAATDLEGYLFPNTYPVPRRTSAAKLVHAMTAQFVRETPHLRAAAAAKGFTARQVVTLASLVEKETARPDERPVVAAVYQNRLRIGMALQCDPTVIYALELAGQWTGNLRRDDLLFDSPYNTYKYPGLPPGPIGSPSRASIEAVIGPADVKYLYFVSRNDGSHEFAATLEEHNRNVRKWQVEYFRQGR